MPKRNFPKTLPAAVQYCLRNLNVGTLKEVAMSKSYADAHFGLGLWIRNELGLWKGNGDLMEAIGCCHPDDASGPIFSALVAYLRRHPDWRSRRRALRTNKASPARDDQT
jgi:hypothetical protein